MPCHHFTHHSSVSQLLDSIVTRIQQISRPRSCHQIVAAIDHSFILVDEFIHCEVSRCKDIFDLQTLTSSQSKCDGLAAVTSSSSSPMHNTPSVGSTSAQKIPLQGVRNGQQLQPPKCPFVRAGCCAVVVVVALGHLFVAHVG